MSQNPLYVRFLYAGLVCALALPLSGWATGQSRFSEEPPTLSVSGGVATATVPTYAVGRSGKAGALLVELRGRPQAVSARREVAFRVEATDADGILLQDATMEVDFGDGTVKTFRFVRRTVIRHVWKEKGSYKMQFRLTDAEGGESRGKLRLRVGPRISTFFQILGDDEAALDEETRWRFVAIEREVRKVAGRMTIDWGDGTPETVVSRFERDARRPHTYTDEGTYTIKASITSDKFGKTTTASLSVKVTEVGGAIDLRDATIAINSAQSIANFKVTSTVTNVTISSSLICIYHTKAGQWPVKDSLEGNPWVAAFVQGKLHAGTYEWLRPGQVCKGLGVGQDYKSIAESIGPHVKHGALAGWVPKPGETSYFWVSTHARLGSRTSDEMALPYAQVWP